LLVVDVDGGVVVVVVLLVAVVDVVARLRPFSSCGCVVLVKREDICCTFSHHQLSMLLQFSGKREEKKPATD